MMDPLSDILALLKPHNYMFHGLDAGGTWSIYFAPRQGIRCYALLSGQFWLTLDSNPEALLFKEGDCFLLPGGNGFTLSSAPRLPPVDAKTIFSDMKEGGLVTYNGGGACHGLGGFFEFSGRHASILLGVLPSIVHIRKESDKDTLRRSLEQIMQELREPQPGGTLIAQYLSSLMLVQALRLFLLERAETSSTTESTGVDAGWLYALADKQIGSAMSAMHENQGIDGLYRALPTVPVCPDPRLQ